MARKLGKGLKSVEKDAGGSARRAPSLTPLPTPPTADLATGATGIFEAMSGRPQQLMKRWLDAATESAVVHDPSSRPTPGLSKSAESKLRGALLQSYVAWSQAAIEVVTGAVAAGDGAADTLMARSRLVTSLLTDTMTPSTNPLLNTAAVKAFVEFGGEAAVAGLTNFLNDMAQNGGLPANLDLAALKVGSTLAATPGSVVFRNEVLEVIQYHATTEMVQRRPLVLLPPQINKFYSVDLSPATSLIRFLLDCGIQPCCVSWRNPTAAQAEWGIDAYVLALDEAVDAIRDISGSDTVNIMGWCSGGVMLSAYVAWLAARQQTKIESVSLAVGLIDIPAESDSGAAALVSVEDIATARQISKARGVIDGHDVAKMFGWMRPHEPVWESWVYAFLLGEALPAFDAQVWNADTTRLPARLHGDLIDVVLNGPFVDGGKLSIDGIAIDMTALTMEAYVVAGSLDEITPWKEVYRTALLFGDRTTFVLSNTGHLQSLLTPPDAAKAWHIRGKVAGSDPDAWVETAERVGGSWWLDWAAFLARRSGDQIAAPDEAGSVTYPPLGPAPGTYVFEP